MSWEKAGKAGAASTAGAAAGFAVTRFAGMTAAAMVGNGAGWGCAAGPLGAVLGGITGLAIYGVVSVVCDDDDD